MNRNSVHLLNHQNEEFTLSKVAGHFIFGGCKSTKVDFDMFQVQIKDRTKNLAFFGTSSKDEESLQTERFSFFYHDPRACNNTFAQTATATRTHVSVITRYPSRSCAWLCRIPQCYKGSSLCTGYVGRRSIHRADL